MTTKSFHVGLDLIVDPGFHRPLSDVRKMTADFRRQGQLKFIHLRCISTNKYEILDGLVRYRSAVELDWQTIRAIIYYDLTTRELAQVKRGIALAKVGT